jgi:hypothetical protein
VEAVKSVDDIMRMVDDYGRLRATGKPKQYQRMHEIRAALEQLTTPTERPIVGGQSQMRVGASDTPC